MGVREVSIRKYKEVYGVYGSKNSRIVDFSIIWYNKSSGGRFIPPADYAVDSVIYNFNEDVRYYERDFLQKYEKQ